jgi:hypothetical protein
MNNSKAMEFDPHAFICEHDKLEVIKPGTVAWGVVAGLLEELHKQAALQRDTRISVNIPIKMGCDCKDVEIGGYQNQVELPTPPHMLAVGSIGCYSVRPTTCIDRCIADTVQALWAQGVVTTGCCCGHNKLDGYIGILVPAPSIAAAQEGKP